MLFLVMKTLSSLILLVTVLAAAPALALPPEVLDKVVRLRPDWPLAQRGVDATGAPRDPEGSGVSLFAGGYVATNAHVIGKAKKVEAMLSDGRLLDAEIVGIDTDTDIALLKLPVELPVFQIAPPPALADPVCTVGNPFGLGLSVTCGVVSAPVRAGVGFNAVEDFVQTDATVNPGASGGALVDPKGLLVGMVSAIFTKGTDADIGVNFATSTRLLLRVADDLKNMGHVQSGDAGIALSPRPAFPGATVVRVEPDGPAFRAGIDAADVVTAAGGIPIIGPADLAALIYMARPGDKITFDVKRGDEMRYPVVTLK